MNDLSRTLRLACVAMTKPWFVSGRAAGAQGEQFCATAKKSAEADAEMAAAVAAIFGRPVYENDKLVPRAGAVPADWERASGTQ